MNDLTTRDDRTVGDVLKCDKCSRGFGESLESAMVFWDTRDDRTVSTLVIAHKERCQPERFPLSFEVDSLADPKRALARLAGLASDYRLTAVQLQRLVDLAWAVSRVATEEQAAKAREIQRLIYGDGS